MESIRQSKTFQERIVNAFTSEDNCEYLYNLLYENLVKMDFSPIKIKYLLHNFFSDIWSFSSSSGYIYSILDSDDIAMRAKFQGGLNVYDELKRVNIAFYQNRMENYLNNEYITNINARAYTNSAPIMPYAADTPMMPYNKLIEIVPIAGAVESNEDYAMTMFISDSLQPEGYEYLNNMGPKSELLENQYEWSNKDGTSKYDMGVANTREYPIITEDDEMEFDFALAMAQTNAIPVNKSSKDKYLNITHEDAIIKHMGENYVTSETALKYNKPSVKYNNNLIGSENGAFMRYKEIPFWQKLPREGTDTDIDETLGFATRETNNHVRGWDMSSLTKGARSYPKYYAEMNGGKH